MGEPSANLEALPYYLNNDIYLYREKVFRKWRKLTTASQQKATFQDVLDAAEGLKKQYGRQVLILLEQQRGPSEEFRVAHSYGAIFEFSKEAFAKFIEKTERLASFHDAIVENYDVYLLK